MKTNLFYQELKLLEEKVLLELIMEFLWKKFWQVE